MAFARFAYLRLLSQTPTVYTRLLEFMVVDQLIGYNANLLCFGFVAMLISGV